MLDSVCARTLNIKFPLILVFKLFCDIDFSLNSFILVVHFLLLVLNMWFWLKMSFPRRGQLSFDFNGGKINWINLLKLKQLNQNTNMKGVSNASLN